MPVTKILHQTYKSADNVPEDWKTPQQKWKQFCESNGWEYRFWTDTDNRRLVAEHYPWFLEKYDSYKYGIQRADVARSFILHRYGGVYVDLDVAPRGDAFDKVIQMYENQSVILAKTGTNNQFGNQDLTNFIMASEPGSTFWEEVWKYYEEPYRHHGWKRPVANSSYYMRVLFTTGPGTISDASRTWVPKTGESAVVLPADLIMESEDNKSAAVLDHVEGNSWHKSDGKFWLGMRGVRSAMPYIHVACTIIFMIATVIMSIMYARSVG